MVIGGGKGGSGDGGGGEWLERLRRAFVVVMERLCSGG